MGSFKRSPLLLGDILKQSLEKWNLSAPFNRYSLFEFWDEIVGKSTAERSRPLRYQGETLLVQVDHSAWLQQLTFLKPQIMKKIREQFPKAGIKNIRFVLK